VDTDSFDDHDDPQYGGYVADEEDIAWEQLKYIFDLAGQVIANAPSITRLGDGKGGEIFELLARSVANYGVDINPYRFEVKTLVARIAKRDGWDCHYCGTALQGKPDRPIPHIDHVIPKSRGGINRLENKVLACPSCNCSKGARTPEEWRAGVKISWKKKPVEFDGGAAK
jgi:hypothetical protein